MRTLIEPLVLKRFVEEAVVAKEFVEVAPVKRPFTENKLVELRSVIVPEVARSVLVTFKKP